MRTVEWTGTQYELQAEEGIFLNITDLDLEDWLLKDELAAAFQKRRFAVMVGFFTPGVPCVDISQSNGYSDKFFSETATGYSLDTAITLLRDTLAPPPRAKSDFDCIINIRGGDYLNLPAFNICGRDYYIKALQALLELQGDIKTAGVITDDPTYAFELIGEIDRQFPAVEFYYDGFNPESKWTVDSFFYDFAAIYNAKARIIPNSTFSWWAAQLDPDEAFTILPSVAPLRDNNRQLTINT
jgi:hypothetical protein